MIQTIHDPGRFEAFVHCVSYFYTNTQPFGILFRSRLSRLDPIGFAIIIINTDASVAEERL
jgi:hypothetical protein